MGKFSMFGGPKGEGKLERRDRRERGHPATKDFETMWGDDEVTTGQEFMVPSDKKVSSVPFAFEVW